MKNNFFLPFVLISSILFISCSDTKNNIDFDINWLCYSTNETVDAVDEKGHWYFDPLNNSMLTYENHDFKYGYTGNECYKKCRFCDYIEKINRPKIGKTDDKYFTFYELSDGTYGVGASALLPENTDTPIDLYIPESYLGKPVTEIVERAFSYGKEGTVPHYNFGYVYIPYSIKTIRRAAFMYDFHGCYILNSGLENIEELAFYCNMSFIFYIPNTVKNIAPTAFYISGAEAIIVDKSNKFYKSVNGVVYSKDNKTVHVYPTSLKKEYEINEGTTLINKYAFASSSLKNVIFPSSLKEVEECAFNESLHGKLTLNSNLEIIGRKAFCSTRLTNTELIIPNSVYDIKEEAFNYGLGSIESIKLPESLKIIEYLSFANNYRLKECTIGVKVSHIKKEAFLGCPIENFIYLGSIVQWNEIKLDEDWNLLNKENNTYISKVICSDGILNI